MNAWLERWILFFSLTAILAVPSVGKAGGESSVGSGIGPDMVAMSAYESSPDVRKALAALTTKGYQIRWGTSATPVGGQCSESDGTMHCDSIYLVTTLLSPKGGGTLRTVVALVSYSRDYHTTVKLVSQDRFNTAMQTMADH